MIMSYSLDNVRFGTKTIGGSTPEDVMQALLAALEFGDDAGYAALYSAERDAVAVADGDTVSLYVGGGTVVRISRVARDLIAAAAAEPPARYEYEDGDMLAVIDLTRRPA